MIVTDSQKFNRQQKYQQNRQPFTAAKGRNWKNFRKPTSANIRQKPVKQSMYTGILVVYLLLLNCSGSWYQCLELSRGNTTGFYQTWGQCHIKFIILIQFHIF